MKGERTLYTKPTQSPYVVKRRSSVHGFGIYARKDIPKGTRIIQYVGERITKKEAERRADEVLFAAKADSDCGAVYIFVLNKRYDIDGNVSYNTAKYINHSCDPNCETENIRGKIWVIALRDIQKGEELNYNYGYDLDDFKDHPCYCRTKRCVGFIASEELWPRLRKLIPRVSKPSDVAI
jgi:SET domain-containing protein